MVRLQRRKSANCNFLGGIAEAFWAKGQNEKKFSKLFEVMSQEMRGLELVFRLDFPAWTNSFGQVCNFEIYPERSRRVKEKS